MTERLPAGVRRRMLLRSFTIQGSWNYETLIGTGFGFSILPALRHIHGRDGERLDDALGRHTELFNSHPYLATVAIGAVSRLEVDGVEPAVTQRFKTALRGSLGSIGDRLVWGTWRPMSVLLGILLVLMGAAWWVAVGAFLLVYNALHLSVRALGLKLGIESGLEVGKRLKALPLQSWTEQSARAGCFLAGAAVVLAAAPASEDPVGVVAVAVSVITGLMLGFRMRGAMIALVAAVVAIALILGMAGYGA